MAEKIYKLSKLGLEDLLFGEGTEVQIRNGLELVVTKINAKNLPFDELNSLKEALDLRYPSVDALTVDDPTKPGGKSINPAIITVANQPTYIEVVGTDLLDENSKVKTVAEDLLLLDDSSIKKTADNIEAIKEVSIDLKETVSEIEVVALNLEKGEDSEVLQVGADLALGDDSNILNAKANAETAVTAADTAITKAQEASDSASAAATSASNAATSESNASDSASAAATSASNAATSESNAATSEDLARRYANEAEDTEVESSTYSAYHWSKKAEANGHRLYNSTSLGDWAVLDNSNELLVNPFEFDTMTIGDGSTLKII